MVWEGRRRETSPYPDQSTNEIAGFGRLEPLIPTISDATATRKQTPAQSLRALFTDDTEAIDDRDDTMGKGRFSLVCSLRLIIWLLHRESRQRRGRATTWKWRCYNGHHLRLDYLIW